MHSLSHLLHHFGHDGGVFEILSIEVLGSVAHSVASISNHRHTDLVLGGFACLVSCFSGVHCNLEAGREGLKVASLTDITVLQSRSHGVDIKEGVLSVLNFGNGLAVHRCMSRVSDSGQVVVSCLSVSLNSLEPIIQSQWLDNIGFYLLGIVEVSGVFQVSLLGRAVSHLESAEVVFREIISIRSSELVLGRRADSLVELAVNSSSGGLSETLGVDVFRLNLRDVASIARDVLGLDVVGGSSEPVIAVLGVVSNLKGFVEFISLGCVGVELTLGEGRFAYCNIDIIIAGLVACLSDDLVNVSLSAAVDVVLLGDVTSVTW